MRSRILTALSLLLAALLLWPAFAAAETAERHGIAAELQTERASYEAGEPVRVRLTVRSTAPRDIVGLTLEHIPPPGWTAAPGSALTEELPLLEAGGTAVFEAVLEPGGAAPASAGGLLAWLLPLVFLLAAGAVTAVLMLMNREVREM